MIVHLMPNRDHWVHGPLISYYWNKYKIVGREEAPWVVPLPLDQPIQNSSPGIQMATGKLNAGGNPVID